MPEEYSTASDGSITVPDINVKPLNDQSVGGYFYSTGNNYLSNYSSPLQTQSDTDWLNKIYGVVNTPTAMGLIGQAAVGAAAMYSADQKNDTTQNIANQTSADNKLWHDQQMAFNREQLAQQMDISNMSAEQAAAVLALQEAIFNDKVATRRAHNDSIAQPSHGAKTISISKGQ